MLPKAEGANSVSSLYHGVGVGELAGVPPEKSAGVSSTGTVPPGCDSSERLTQPSPFALLIFDDAA